MLVSAFMPDSSMKYVFFWIMAVSTAPSPSAYAGTLSMVVGVGPARFIHTISRVLVIPSISKRDDCITIFVSDLFLEGKNAVVPSPGLFGR